MGVGKLALFALLVSCTCSCCPERCIGYIEGNVAGRKGLGFCWAGAKSATELQDDGMMMGPHYPLRQWQRRTSKVL